MSTDTESWLGPIFKREVGMSHANYEDDLSGRDRSMQVGDLLVFLVF